MAATTTTHLSFVPRTSSFSKSTNVSRSFLSRSRTVVLAVSSGSSYWTSVNADIQNHLSRIVQAKPPLSVHEPLRHFALLSPPDNDMAAALCVASYELVGGQNRDEAVEVAAALRLLYAVSYTHRPLLSGTMPVMLQEPYEPGIQLMTGDGLMPFAMEMLARPENLATEDSGRVLRVMIEAMHTTGSQGMVLGQYRELLRRKSSDGEGLRSYHVEGICETSEKMEGKVHACSAACGAILGVGNKDQIDKLRSFGLNVGKMWGVLKRWKREGQLSGAILKEVEEMKDLAINKLKSFEAEKVEAMFSLIDVYLGSL